MNDSETKKERANVLYKLITENDLLKEISQALEPLLKRGEIIIYDDVAKEVLEEYLSIEPLGLQEEVAIEAIEDLITWYMELRTALIK